ncbi:MAG: hypothetical protein QF486_02085 [Candidatus Woesearchaeota archaeon]|jgi:hypothetical protein|nr:hypothetical protein [Candidatus Woesearchaeota archaeon]MDP7180996.1 hypothetical protein [Candidatus Woesearchaeota archaeon]MDP7198383.1 hypothetical protein [Candidatus Woesearchaeota archaeon]MDP7467485.1 hypothetical protein [Candidatus Woesearchaeota archaeon]MDP7647712.1 hypothetical protein [Candidatus Woesearchaeota archaeon]
MNKTTLLEVLRQLSEKAPALWRLDGSCNLLVQNIDVQPKDVDICTTKEGVDAFAKAFGVEARQNPEIESYNATFEVEGVEVDVNFYDTRPELNMLDTVCWVDWKNLKLPCLPLCDAKRFYEMIDRKDKVELLEEY